MDETLVIEQETGTVEVNQPDTEVHVTSEVHEVNVTGSIETVEIIHPDTDLIILDDGSGGGGGLEAPQDVYPWLIYADDPFASVYADKGISNSSTGKNWLGVRGNNIKPYPIVGIDIVGNSDLVGFSWSKVKGEDGDTPNVNVEQVADGQYEITIGNQVFTLSDGNDGEIPTVTDNGDGTYTITDPNGTTVTLKDGETPEFGVDYFNGNNGDYHSYVYRNSTTRPATPTGGSFDGETETFPTGTTDTPEPVTGDQKRWVSSKIYKHDATEDEWSVRRDWSTFELHFEKGENGPEGKRGIGEFVRYITGSTWSNTEADLAVIGAKRSGDRVTLFNNIDFVETRYWDGSIWNDAEQKIVNGALIVNGDAIIPQIFSNAITVTESVTAENNGVQAQMSAVGDYVFLASRNNKAIFAIGGNKDIVDGNALKSKSVLGSSLTQDAIETIRTTLGITDPNTGGIKESTFTFNSTLTGQRASIINFTHGDDPMFVSVSFGGYWEVDYDYQVNADIEIVAEISSSGANSWTELFTYSPDVSSGRFQKSLNGGQYVYKYYVQIEGDKVIGLSASYPQGDYDLRLRVTKAIDTQNCTGIFSIRENARGQVSELEDNPSFSRITLDNMILAKSNNQLNIDTGYGSIQIGPYNDTWAHFKTSQPNGFWFDSPITAVDKIEIYNADTYLTQDYLHFNNKQAIKGNDEWLRINQSSDFSYGIYTGSSKIRSDEGYELGANGSDWFVNDTGMRTRVGAYFENRVVIDNNGQLDFISPNNSSAVVTTQVTSSDWLRFRCGGNSDIQGIEISNYDNAGIRLSRGGNIDIYSSSPEIRFNVTGANDFAGIRSRAPNGNDGELEFWVSDDYSEPFVWRSYDVGERGTGSYREWMRLDNNGLTVDGDRDTAINVVSDNDGVSEVNVYGAGQGTGRVYVGQDMGHGGGFEYNGDGSPSSSSSIADTISFFRRHNNSNTEVFYYRYSSNNVYFKGECEGPDFIATSDKRIKSDITEITNAMEKVKQIRGTTYLNKLLGTRKAGLIAQEVEKVLPEAVLTKEDGYKAVSLSGPIALVIAALTEVEKRLEKVEKQIG